VNPEGSTLVSQHDEDSGGTKRWQSGTCLPTAAQNGNPAMHSLSQHVLDGALIREKKQRKMRRVYYPSGKNG
jgi:hypothetical protein